jgi:hypothetical protein
MLLDGQIRHYDILERHETVVDASREGTCRAVREFDFVPVLIPAARSILEMRDVPRSIQEIVHRVQHLPADAKFTLADAPARGFVVLGERRGRSIMLGAIGKLWKPDLTLLPVDPAEFRAFHEPKYAKLAIAFWVERIGRDKSGLRFEARVAATDDSARTHLERWYRVVGPFTAFFLRRALAGIKAEAEAIASVTA